MRFTRPSSVSPLRLDLLWKPPAFLATFRLRLTALLSFEWCRSASVSTTNRVNPRYRLEQQILTIQLGTGWRTTCTYMRRQGWQFVVRRGWAVRMLFIRVTPFPSLNTLPTH